jgi:hypothetical protein
MERKNSVWFYCLDLKLELETRTRYLVKMKNQGWD